MAATGGTISYSGAYTIHTFTSSGTFRPLLAGTMEVLVVAGGGGGTVDSTCSGGGGGGGIKYSATHSVSPQDYTVSVGGGGSTGNAGGNSIFDTLTATGGQPGVVGGPGPFDGGYLFDEFIGYL